MKKAKWMGMPIVAALVSFWSCIGLGESEELVESDPTERDASTPEERPSMEELRASAEAEVSAIEARAREAIRAEEEAERASIPVVSVRPRRRTEVQSAPDYYPGFHYSTLPAERRRMAERFNRNLPEAELIGDNTSLYNVTLLVLSRGIVHESNFMHRPCGTYHTACDTSADRNHAEIDGPAMYAAFRYTRATGETLIGTIRRHMRYVTERVPPVSNRSRWITELTLEGTRPPSFPADLNWERDYQPRWLQVIEMARRLLSGHDLGVCAHAPIQTWGGRCEDSHGACDDFLGSHRGLVPYDCGDSSNRFWCRPGPRCPNVPLSEVLASEGYVVTETRTGVVVLEVSEAAAAPVETPPPPIDTPVAEETPSIEETEGPLALSL